MSSVRNFLSFLISCSLTANYFFLFSQELRFVFRKGTNFCGVSGPRYQSLLGFLNLNVFQNVRNLTRIIRYYKFQIRTCKTLILNLKSSQSFEHYVSDFYSYGSFPCVWKLFPRHKYPPSMKYVRKSLRCLTGERRVEHQEVSYGAQLFLIC